MTNYILKCYSLLENLLMNFRRKRIVFCADHMGMRELDLLVGSFAKTYVPGMSNDLLDQFEALLQEENIDLFNWITGKEMPPKHIDTPLFKLIVKHKNNMVKY